MEKIMYLLNHPGKGGSEKYVLDLIRAAGIDNCIFVYSENGPGLEDFRETGVKMFQVKMTRPLDFTAASRLKKLIEQENIKVVHAQFLRENYVSILSKLMGASIKVIWTYHVDVPMNKVIRSLNNVMTRLNHSIITVSKFMFQQLQKKGIPEHKLQLIYNGVQEPVVKATMTQLREVPVISVIGRLREEKGQEFLLRSLATLANKNKDAKWVCHLYGEGPQKEELVSLAKKLKIESRVEFCGFSADKDKLYLNSDIIVIPSSNEALSYVAIEALSYGRIVVATNVGGLPEVIKDNETGFLVDYDDTSGLANQLETVLTDENLVQRLSNNGRKFFDSQFTMSKMIEKTFAQYQK